MDEVFSDPQPGSKDQARDREVKAPSFGAAEDKGCSWQDHQAEISISSGYAI